MKEPTKEPDLRPTCPKCGCPARWVKGRATVLAMLKTDGSPGPIHREGSMQLLPEAVYICGGEHEWAI
jgi:hypothetical protein